MSDTAPNPAEPETPAQGEPDKPAKPETDWKVEAKKWESRAKENKGAADKLAAIEEANKTEAQRNADRLAAAEKDAADARREALKFKIAAKFAIGDEDADLLLTGADEETMTRQAQRVGAQEAERKKQGNFVPREGNNPKSKSGNGDMREFTRNLFAND